MLAMQRLRGWYVLVPSIVNSADPLTEQWWSHETHRIEVFAGALSIYRRFAHTSIDGDNDVLELAYGAGSWVQVRTIFEDKQDQIEWSMP